MSGLCRPKLIPLHLSRKQAVRPTSSHVNDQEYVLPNDTAGSESDDGLGPVIPTHLTKRRSSAPTSVINTPVYQSMPTQPPGTFAAPSSGPTPAAESTTAHAASIKPSTAAKLPCPFPGCDMAFSQQGLPNHLASHQRKEAAKQHLVSSLAVNKGTQPSGEPSVTVVEFVPIVKNNKLGVGEEVEFQTKECKPLSRSDLICRARGLKVLIRHDVESPYWTPAGRGYKEGSKFISLNTDNDVIRLLTAAAQSGKVPIVYFPQLEDNPVAATPGMRGGSVGQKRPATVGKPLAPRLLCPAPTEYEFLVNDIMAALYRDYESLQGWDSTPDIDVGVRQWANVLATTFGERCVASGMKVQLQDDEFWGEIPEHLAMKLERACNRKKHNKLQQDNFSAKFKPTQAIPKQVASNKPETSAHNYLTGILFTHKWASSCVLDVSDLVNLDFRKGSQVQVLKEIGHASCIKFEYNDGYKTGWVETSYLIPLQSSRLPDIPAHLKGGTNKNGTVGSKESTSEQAIFTSRKGQNKETSVFIE